jgi:hypothetical protein
MLGDQARELEAALVRADGRRQIQREIAWLERRLALLQIP